MHKNDVVYFNNCEGRDHAVLFAPGAFFDLDTSGAQAQLVPDIEAGQHCVVASYATDRQSICFDWHRLTVVRIMPTKKTKKPLYRVFFGDEFCRAVLDKTQAARAKPYASFFDSRGRFRQQSVMIVEGAAKYRPTLYSNRAYTHPRGEFTSKGEVDASNGSYFEGTTRSVTLDAYERSASARRACLKKHGTACHVCGIDFGRTYGPEAAGFIHVHHVVQISTLKASYKVDPEKDLRPVCPNCHAMLHLGGCTNTIETVKAMMAKNANP